MNRSIAGSFYFDKILLDMGQELFFEIFLPQSNSQEIWLYINYQQTYAHYPQIYTRVIPKLSDLPTTIY